MATNNTSELPFDFDDAFRALTGHTPLTGQKPLPGHTPFPWQRRLFNEFSKGELPSAIDIPTGLGKTAATPAKAAAGQFPRAYALGLIEAPMTSYPRH